MQIMKPVKWVHLNNNQTAKQVGLSLHCKDNSFTKFLKCYQKISYSSEKLISRIISFGLGSNCSIISPFKG